MLLTEGPDSAFRTPHSTLVIGTRGSPLALWQANHVAERLRAAFPALTVHLEAIKTTGDKILDVPLAKVGGKALFVKEIEEALLDRRVDLAVHSMKDVPTELPHGLTIGAVTEREDAHDVLISRTGVGFKDLPSGARVGTSSLRRQAQLLHHRPDLQIVGLRGNLDTRIRKLAAEGLDAIVVAAAGVKRLGLMDRILEFIPPDISLPAIGQGALGIEILEPGPIADRAPGDVQWVPETARFTRAEAQRRSEKPPGLTRGHAGGPGPSIQRIVSILDHANTHVAVMAERVFLRRLGGGCQVPFAAHARILNDQVVLRGLVATPDGMQMIVGERQGPRTAGDALGTALAEDLLSRGAGEIIRALLPAP